MDINTASFDELRRIIHIDEERANQILNERERREFDSVDEMEPRIRGIGRVRLADIKEQDLACVGR